MSIPKGVDRVSEATHVVFVALIGELNCCTLQHAVFPFYPKALQILVQGKVRSFLLSILESCVCSYTLNNVIQRDFYFLM